MQRKHKKDIETELLDPACTRPFGHVDIETSSAGDKNHLTMNVK